MVASRYLCAVLLASLPLVGCSLTGVTDITPGECTTDKGCQDALNSENGFYEGCAAFACVSGQCQPIAVEICDGKDNDCDYLIDEADSSGDDALLSLAESEFATGIPEPRSASFANSTELSRVYLQLEGESSVWGVDRDSGEGQVARAMAQAEPNGVSEDRFIELEAGCFAPGSDWATGCNLNEVVTAADDEVGYYAQINTNGCVAGELHVGIIDPAAPEQLVDRGRGFRSASYRGVATRGSRCSDNGTEACSAAKALADEGSGTSSELAEACGVSRPSISEIETQALVSYLGLGQKKSQCAQATPSAVYGIVVHRRTPSSGSTFYWGDTSGDGEPEELGETRGAGAPATVGLGDLGFLVAHGDAEENVRLIWMPSQQPPISVGTDCGGDCDARPSENRTAPLAGVEEFVKLASPGGSVVDGVSLSFEPIYEEDSEELREGFLTVTWMDRCGDGSSDFEADAFAQLLRVSFRDGHPEITEEFARIALGKTQVAPLPHPSDAPFVAPGFERGGEVSNAENSGGVFVFTRPDNSAAARIAFFDGALIDPAPISLPSSTSQPLIGLEPGTVLTYDDGSGTLSEARLSCE